MTTRPSAIDLSTLPAPSIIEELNVELINAEVRSHFIDLYPAFTAALESEPIIRLFEVVAYREFLLRQRYNDAVRSVLAPMAAGSNLDSVVARQNVQRRVVVPADEQRNIPAVMESDEALLRRYLLSFDMAAAGTASRYLFEAWTAWPQSADKSQGMLDARVNGHTVHGRRGDVDIVITGPGGRLPTTEERAAVRAAVTAPNVQPETTAVTVIPAARLEYAVSLVLHVPDGPDASVVRADAMARVAAAIAERTLIGGFVPLDRISGAAYGPNIIRVECLSPSADIVADAYSVPVCTDIVIESVVAA